jgi:hypothetical protein
MVKINEHLPTPNGIDTYKHASQTVQSPNHAGGEVPPGQYRQSVTPPEPPPVTLDHWGRPKK